MLSNEIRQYLLNALRAAADNGDLPISHELIRAFTDMTPPEVDTCGIAIRVGNDRPNFPGQTVLIDADVAISLYTHLDEDADGMQLAAMFEATHDVLDDMDNAITDGWHLCGYPISWTYGDIQTDGTYRGMTMTATIHGIKNDNTDNIGD